MNFEISSGIKENALKIVIYGVEGIGKTSLAAQFPDPLFIDTEGSTKTYDVKRLKNGEAPSSWTELIQMIEFVKETKPCSTLVIDTADWAQVLAERSVLAENNWKSIEQPGYGEGYVRVREKWGNFLDKLTDVTEAGINVVITAHAEIKKFEDPTELGAYDRYELKLAKRSNAHIAGVTKEWADMVLFLNYETYSVKREGMGSKFQGQGGQRMMFTTHHPAYDAKNRFNLPEKMPLNYDGIAHVIPNLQGKTTSVQQSTYHAEEPEQTTLPVNQKECYPELNKDKDTVEDLDPNILSKELVDLMKSNSVTQDEIRGVMGVRGHYPINTSFETIAQTTPQYFSQGLAANWDSVMAIVKSIRQNPQQLVDLFEKVGDPNAKETVRQMKINK